MVTYHHIDKWAYANLDMIEEALEKKQKAIVFIAGASSSGKSYLARYLHDVLRQNGHRSVIISLDQYNRGLSGIIPDKVKDNYFDGYIDHLDEIKSIIKDIIIDIPFDKKYDEKALSLIKEKISGYFSESDLNNFLRGLNEEWKVVNFDEPSVYDLKEAAGDVKKLFDGGVITAKNYSKVVSERVPTGEVMSGDDYEVIIVEGIYALDNDMVNEFKSSPYVIRDFIDGNAKSLFVRRIVRDAKATSADNVFTISIYFKFIVKSYKETIFPNRLNADIILYNDMTFSELRAGELYTTKEEIRFTDKDLFETLLKNSQIQETIYQRDIYFNAPGENLLANNVLRLRCLSNDKGKTYTLSSLVHKGSPKVRKDNKIIRPINVLLREGEVNKVWKDEGECLRDFLIGGFLIGPVQRKIKYRLTYQGLSLVVREVEGDSYRIEFARETPQKVVKAFANAIEEHRLPEKIELS